MKKLIVMVLTMLMLLALCCSAAQAAQSASTPKYPIFLRVYYLDDTYYNTCNNSAGYIVMTTRRQDGSPGTTWWAEVKAGEWDTRSTCCYTFGCSGSQGNIVGGIPALIDGIPTEIRLVKEKSATSTNYMTNDNKTYITHYGFEVCLKKSAANWDDFISLARFVETTGVGGKWSDEKKLGTDIYPYVANVKSGSTTGPSAAYIPMPGTGMNTYQFNSAMVDQYGAEWYQDNANVHYSLGDNLPYSGVSINDSGVLTVTGAAASSATSGPVFQSFVRAEVVNPPGNVNNTLPLTLSYPQLTVRYYNEAGNQTLSVQYAYLWTQWTHNVTAPAKNPDANCHYSFRGWEVNNSSHSIVSADETYLLTQDTTFTARYTSAGHSMALNADCTHMVCSVCGYAKTATLSDFLNGSGTQSAPYRIAEADDWNHLAAYISSGGDVSGKHFRLDSDISVSVSLGTSDHPFTGFFNGNSHSLNAALSSTDDCCAPFSWISGATIRNLTITGSILGGNHTSGLVGAISGDSLIENVQVSASVSTGRSYCGGFVGHGGNGHTTTLRNCLFCGTISAFHGATLWGWSDGGIINLEGCLDVSGSDFPIGLGSGTKNITATYYINPNKTSGTSRVWSDRGRLAHPVTGGDGLSVSLIGETGFVWNSVIYAASGTTVMLDLSAEPWEGYTLTITPSAGTLAAANTGWALTMPDQEVTISLLRTPMFATAPAVDLTMGGSSGGYDDQGAENLFDGLDNTKWCCAFNGQNWVEFQTDMPVLPIAYAMTTGDDTARYTGRNPISWRLLGRQSAEDVWTALTVQTNNGHLPAENCVEVFFPLYGTVACQYYRLEVTAIQSKKTLQLSGFKLIGTPLFGTPDFTLPASLTEIEEEAFEGVAMKVAYVPNGCTSIGDRAFKDCLSLRQIRIPADCTLGAGVFDSCETVYVFSAAGSPADIYCQTHNNCEFVAMDADGD